MVTRSFSLLGLRAGMCNPLRLLTLPSRLRACSHPLLNRKSVGFASTHVRLPHSIDFSKSTVRMPAHTSESRSAHGGRTVVLLTGICCAVHGLNHHHRQGPEPDSGGAGLRHDGRVPAALGRSHGAAVLRLGMLTLCICFTMFRVSSHGLLKRAFHCLGPSNANNGPRVTDLQTCWLIGCSGFYSPGHNSTATPSHWCSRACGKRF